jgi:excisionase family DNA binding protein
VGIPGPIAMLLAMTRRGIQTDVADIEIEPLLTIDRGCEWLQISRQTMYRLIARGELSPVRVGERLRLVPKDVRDYLERNRESSPEMREAGFPASEPLADENVNEHPTAT